MLKLSHTQDTQKQMQKDFFFLKACKLLPSYESYPWKMCVKHVRSHSTPPFLMSTQNLFHPDQILRTCTTLQQNHSLPQSWQSSEFSFQSGQSVHNHLSCIFLLHHTPMVGKLQKTAVSGGWSQNLQGKVINYSYHNRLWNSRTDKKSKSCSQLAKFLCVVSQPQEIRNNENILTPFRHQRQNYSNMNKLNPSSCLRRNARHIYSSSAKNSLDKPEVFPHTWKNLSWSLLAWYSNITTYEQNDCAKEKAG